MPDLRLETLTLPAASLGPPNPLPPLTSPTVKYTPINMHQNVPARVRKHIGYGCDVGVLPYRVQDQYNRERQPREFLTIVFENDHLHATFLPELGGRLYSLIHKSTSRNLLYSNPVFQPANLAVRNAWFSGGVEFNCSIPGHSPLTCSPVFFSRVRSDDGSPILRLYDFERIRQIVYQIDFHLPDTSPFLFARVRIINPHEIEIPMYWWTNIAVPETQDTRVIAPAEAAYSFGLTGVLQRVPVPRSPDHTDNTYPTNARSASDFFYDIPDNQRPFITALDKNGAGLVHTSTAAQRGRKMFAWGMSPGGRHWQEFLSIPGNAYLEIQAGVAPTQYESFPLAPRSSIAWLEAFGELSANPAAVHAQNWATARAETQAALDRALPSDKLESLFLATAASADRAPEEILHRGFGWGALENSRRQRTGEPLISPPALVFDDSSLTAYQAPWLSLLHNGYLLDQDPLRDPGSFMIQDHWRQLLMKSADTERGNHWFTHFHLGIMFYAIGHPDRARIHWQKSITLTPNPWSLRNLAVDALHHGDADSCADLLLRARQMVPASQAVAMETMRALLTAHRSADLLNLLDQLPSEIRFHGRTRLYEAQAAMDSGNLSRAHSILSQPLQVPDIREGEVQLSDLWYTLQERTYSEAHNAPLSPELKQQIRADTPPPPWLDFRMTDNPT